METLQARFRDTATQMLQETPTIVVAMGRGRTFSIETFYFVGDSNELSCIVKPNPEVVEAVRGDAQVAFTVNKGFPNRMLQGTGRAFFVGGLDQHPQTREQMLAKAPDAVSFLTTIRNLGVLKILPDQIYLTDDANLGLGPRPVYSPEAARALPKRRSRWVQAIGVSSWSLSLMPVLVASLLALDAPLGASWGMVIPVVVAVLLLQSGIILLRTYQDFNRDRDGGDAIWSSRVLRDGLLPMHQVLWGGILLLGVSSTIGLFLAMQRGAPLLFLGLIGLLGGLLFTGWPVRLKDRIVDDAVILLLMGPLLVSGTYYVLTGAYHYRVLVVSLSIGCLADAALHAGHLRSLPAAAARNIRTMATLLGWGGAKRAYYTLVGVPYLLIVALIVAGLLPGWAWLTLLSAPLSVRNVASLWRVIPEQAQSLDALDRQTVQLHVAFGMLLALGLLLGNLT